MDTTVAPIAPYREWQDCRTPSISCQIGCTLGSMLNNVAVVLLDGVHPFELGVVCEVFGLDRSDEGLPVYDFAVVSAEAPGASLSTHVAGFTVATPYGLDRLEEADLVVVPAGSTYAVREYPPEMLDALRRAVDRGARVLSVCSGVFVLGAAGLLDERRCAVHWQHVDTLARQYPRARVEADVLYVDEDPVITSAGTAAASTPVCTSSARSRAPRSPTPSPAAWWYPRTGTAARPSTSSGRCRARSATRSARCSPGWSATSTRR